MNSQLKYGEIRDIAANLNTNAGNMADKLQEITNLFNLVGSESWQGDAAAETRAKLDTISSKFHEFHEAVKSESDYLYQMVANYEAADAAARTMM
jgi:WXG100 family type VII secretion target